MKEILQYTLESFFRAVIRFWDNRFSRKEDPIEYYQEEVLYLRRSNEELQSFLLNSLSPTTAQVDSPEPENPFENMGRAIESPLQKRRRLEQDSLVRWNKLVQEGQEKLKAIKESASSLKTTEELEKDLGVNN